MFAVKDKGKVGGQLRFVVKNRESERPINY
jgi:hypothetical protein